MFRGERKRATSHAHGEDAEAPPVKTPPQGRQMRLVALKPVSLLAAVLLITSMFALHGFIASPDAEYPDPLAGGAAAEQQEQPRQRGSALHRVEDVERLPRYNITAEEARDVFLVRPNWRRADRSRRPYVFRGAKATPEPEDVFAGTSTFAFRGEGGAVAEEERGQPAGTMQEADEDKVRVLIVVFSTAANKMTCTVVASAYLSGLPIVMVGYQHKWLNFTIKQFGTHAAVQRAGLRPHDVLVLMDSDTLFTSGPDFVRSLDRFIRYSPESAAELDARDVRDDAGEMIAPVLYTSERNCMFFDLLGDYFNVKCALRMRNYSMDAYDRYMKSKFPEEGEYRPHGERVHAFLNSGMVVTRLWAFNEFMGGFRKLVDGPVKSKLTRKNRTGKWKCDQSVVGGLLSDLLKHEIAIDIFHAGNGADVRLNPPLSTYGLRPGLLAADFTNAFTFAVMSRAYYAKLNDRYLQAASLAATGQNAEDDSDGVATWRRLRDEMSAMYSLSFTPKSQWVATLTGGVGSAADAGAAGFTLEVSNRYFGRPSTASDGLSLASGRSKAIQSRVVTMPCTSALRHHCIAETFYRASTGAVPGHVADVLVEKMAEEEELLKSGREPAASRSLPTSEKLNCMDAPLRHSTGADWFAQPRHARGSNVSLFSTRRMYLSRHPDVTSMEEAPLLIGMEMFYRKGEAYPPFPSLFPPKPIDARFMEYNFPPILHFPGRMKRVLYDLTIPLTSWGAPLFHAGASPSAEGNESEDGFVRARRFLSSMPMEMWSVDGLRVREPFSKTCMASVGEWLVDRQERTARRPYPASGSG